MNILVLGSEGFIGSHLVKHFLNAGHTVHGADLMEAASNHYQYHRISRLSPEFHTLLKEHSFDTCINAAGSGNVPYSMLHPVTDFEANTLDVILLLDNLRQIQPGCRYIHISSAAVYGNPVALPLTETHPCKPVSPYGFHKLMSEMICHEYASLYDLQVAIVRPFSVYGPGLRKQLLWDICSRLNISDQARLFGTGNETRDFIHVEDLVELIHCIILRGSFSAGVYNAASGIETSIRAVASVFEEYYAGQKEISFSGETRTGDPINWRADISGITALGYQPRFDLKDSIAEYISWYEQYINREKTNVFTGINSL